MDLSESEARPDDLDPRSAKFVRVHRGFMLAFDGYHSERSWAATPVLQCALGISLIPLPLLALGNVGYIL